MSEPSAHLIHKRLAMKHQLETQPGNTKRVRTSQHSPSSCITVVQPSDQALEEEDEYGWLDPLLRPSQTTLTSSQVSDPLPLAPLSLSPPPPSLSPLSLPPPSLYNTIEPLDPLLQPSEPPKQAIPASTLDSSLSGLLYTMPDIPAETFTKELSAEEVLELYNTMTYEHRNERQEQLDTEKGTVPAYDRHIEAYEDFWDVFQVREQMKNPSLPRIPAYPINPTKVTLFLEYEIVWPKVIFFDL